MIFERLERAGHRLGLIMLTPSFYRRAQRRLEYGIKRGETYIDINLHFSLPLELLKVNPPPIGAVFPSDRWPSMGKRGAVSAACAFKVFLCPFRSSNTLLNYTQHSVFLLSCFLFTSNVVVMREYRILSHFMASQGRFYKDVGPWAGARFGALSTTEINLHNTNYNILIGRLIHELMHGKFYMAPEK